MSEVTVPLPALLIAQAQFVTHEGKVTPGPAKLVFLRSTPEGWTEEVLEDPESNVFHKAMPWRDGVLTIGGMGANLKHWKRENDVWKATTLWSKSWGGKFDRLRDVEIADLDGDGREEIALATHDMGVVAVGKELDGNWVFTEIDQAPDTFVHEIEVGDLDGDGAMEFYATPSARNRASGESQPGGVVRYSWKNNAWERTILVSWEQSHAKEILVVKLDGKDTLFAVREAHTKKGEDRSVEIVDPVQIVRYTGSGWVPAATLLDQQCRFLNAGDVDGDGQIELVAAGFKSGLWLLERGENELWTPTIIDAQSGGYEHATHLADLDGDGRPEIYVASDNDREIRRYIYRNGTFQRDTLAKIPERHITWNLQSGRF